MAILKDVKRDGLLEPIAYVSTEALELTAGDAEEALEGTTFDGKLIQGEIQGTDSIRVVP
jgi:hypothetical protein